MQFTASRTLSRKKFIKHEVLGVAAFRNIKAGKELFVDYGWKFKF